MSDTNADGFCVGCGGSGKSTTAIEVPCAHCKATGWTETNSKKSSTGSGTKTPSPSPKNAQETHQNFWFLACGVGAAYLNHIIAPESGLVQYGIVFVVTGLIGRGLHKALTWLVKFTVVLAIFGVVIYLMTLDN